MREYCDKCGNELAESQIGLCDSCIDDKEQFPGFEFEGDNIVNPTMSPCGRFFVSPEQYGFSIIDTGGGYTAWWRQLEGDSYIMLTSEGSGSHEIEDQEMFLLGFYRDKNDLEGTIYYMKAGAA